MLLNKLSELRKCCSIQDLALMWQLNQDEPGGALTLTGDLSADAHGYSYGLERLWYTDVESGNFVDQQIRPLLPMVKEEIFTRLLCESARDPRYSKPYELLDQTGQAFHVVIYPGFFGGGEAAKYQEQLTRDILKLSYVYEGIEGMAMSRLFDRYVASL